MRLAQLLNPKSITTFSFGHVISPITVQGNQLYSYLEYDITDLAKLINDIGDFYSSESGKSQRKKEIAFVAKKRAELLKKEKRLHGRIWSPIKATTKT